MGYVGTRDGSESERRVLGTAVRNNWLARLQQLEPGAARRGRRGRHAEPHPVLVCVQLVIEVRFRVVPANADVAGVEDLAQLVADQVDNGLEVELGRHSLLNAIDHRELRGALLGFFQQTLRFVEQPRILERSTQRGSNRSDQAQLGFAVGVLALVVFDGDHPKCAVAADDGNSNGRFALVRAWDGNETDSFVIGSSTEY